MFFEQQKYFKLVKKNHHSMNKFKINYIVLFFFIFSINTKCQNTVITVYSYGAIGSDTNDDTNALQKSVDYLASKNGGTLIIPKGTYYVSHLYFLSKKYSNITIKGDDAIILQTIPNTRKSMVNGQFKTFANRLGADGCFLFDAQVSDQKNDANSIKNIKISGLTFKSDVEKYGFDELLHQISAHGVSNFVIDNCKFIGFFGDAIAINGGTDFTKNRNAYNKDIKIKNCSFDGVNKDNRQGISIYYADGFVIDNCHFKNITRDGMPGAIDIESDSPTNVSRNGIISNCTFQNIGGISAIVINLRESTKENDYSYTNFSINNCSFLNVGCSVAVLGNDSFTNYTSSPKKVVSFTNSKVENAYCSVDLRKAYGMLIENVNFSKITNKGNNVVTEGGAKDITFKNCIFDDVLNPNGLGFYGNTSQINFIGTIFKNFTNNGITINSLNGVGEFSNNQFLSTKTKGGLPLVTQYFKSKKQIENAKFIGNKSQQNFAPLDINLFYKPK